MRSNVARVDDDCQVIPDSQPENAEGNELSLMLQFLREAIDESGWKHAALAVQMNLPNAAYLSRMLSGEKPWTLVHLLALPDKIEKRFAKKWYEHRGGVTVPKLRGQRAALMFAAGALGVFGAMSLPARSNGQLKAELPKQARRRA